MHGRTEYTPRPIPDETSIRSIMIPASNGYIPYDEKTMLYDAPDVINPFLYPPTGSLDVRVIVSLGSLPQNNSNISSYSERSGRTLSKIEPGLGAYLYDNLSGFCDGSPQSWCDKDKDSVCLLSGYNDQADWDKNRSGIFFDPFSGWVVMRLADVKHGIVMVKLDLVSIENKRTKDWTEVNNEKRLLRTLDKSSVFMSENKRSYKFQRHLLNDPGMSTIPHPECLLEYAIDGKITTLDKDAILKKKLTLTLLEPPPQLLSVYSLLYEDEYHRPEELEIALRVTGYRERQGGTYRLTHVYWS